MGANSKIEWTATILPDGRSLPGYSFNPWIGCTKVAPGCTHCYAESLAKRTRLAKWGPSGTRVKTSEAYWRQPLKWDRAAAKAGRRDKVFCASLADVFEDWNGTFVLSGQDQTMCCPSCGLGCGMPIIRRQLGPPIDECPRCKATMVEPTMGGVRRMLFALIDATPHLDWLLLTKRPKNILRMWPIEPAGYSAPPIPTLPALPVHQRKYRPNCWLGTSVATQDDADANVPALLACRDLAAVRFVSAEPLLGPLDLSPWLENQDFDEDDPDDQEERELCDAPALLDWLIVGGESGPGARPMHPDWARSLRDQCQAAGVPFFFKHCGEWAPHVYCAGCALAYVPAGDGMDHRMMRVGAKVAGRFLDGREWNEYPKIAAVV